jgi:hypothetical protein
MGKEGEEEGQVDGVEWGRVSDVLYQLIIELQRYPIWANDRTIRMTIKSSTPGERRGAHIYDYADDSGLAVQEPNKKPPGARGIVDNILQQAKE